jgi:hypothetical protein
MDTTALYSGAGSAIVIAVFLTIQQCIKHKIHTRFISQCCQTEIDIDANTPKYTPLSKE